MFNGVLQYIMLFNDSRAEANTAAATSQVQFKQFHLCNISKWLFILNQHLGELQTLLWIDPHYIPQQKDPVWSVANLQD